MLRRPAQSPLRKLRLIPHLPELAGAQAHRCGQAPGSVRISHFSSVVGTGGWSTDILVQCRQELRLGLTRAKDVLGGSGANPKAEGRRPKEGRNPKAEARIALGLGFRSSDFGTRPSFGLRASGFGLQSQVVLSGGLLLRAVVAAAISPWSGTPLGCWSLRLRGLGGWGNSGPEARPTVRPEV